MIEDPPPLITPVVLGFTQYCISETNRLAQLFANKSCDICAELSSKNTFETLRPILAFELNHRCVRPDRDIFQAMVKEHERIIENVCKKSGHPVIKWTVDKLMRHFGSYDPRRACVKFMSRVKQHEIDRTYAAIDDMNNEGFTVTYDSTCNMRRYNVAAIDRLYKIVNKLETTRDDALKKERAAGVLHFDSYSNSNLGIVNKNISPVANVTRRGIAANRNNDENTPAQQMYQNVQRELNQS